MPTNSNKKKLKTTPRKRKPAKPIAATKKLTGGMGLMPNRKRMDKMSKLMKRLKRDM